MSYPRVLSQFLKRFFAVIVIFLNLQNLSAFAASDKKDDKKKKPLEEGMVKVPWRWAEYLKDFINWDMEVDIREYRIVTEKTAQNTYEDETDAATKYLNQIKKTNKSVRRSKQTVEKELKKNYEKLVPTGRRVSLNRLHEVFRRSNIEAFNDSDLIDYFYLHVTELFELFGVTKERIIEETMKKAGKDKLILDIGTNMKSDFLFTPSQFSTRTLRVDYPVVVEGERNLTKKENMCFGGILSEKENRVTGDKNTSPWKTKNVFLPNGLVDPRRFLYDGGSFLDILNYFVLGFEANPGTWMMSQKFENPAHGAILPIAITDSRAVVKINVDDRINTCDSIAKTRKPPPNDEKTKDEAFNRCVYVRSQRGLVNFRTPSRPVPQVLKDLALQLDDADESGDENYKDEVALVYVSNADELAKLQDTYIDDMSSEEVNWHFDNLFKCMDTHYNEYSYALSKSSPFSKEAYFGNIGNNRNATRRSISMENVKNKKVIGYKEETIDGKMVEILESDDPEENFNLLNPNCNGEEEVCDSKDGGSDKNPDSARHHKNAMEVPSVAIRDILKYIIPEEMKTDLLKIDSQGLDLAIFQSSMPERKSAKWNEKRLADKFDSDEEKKAAQNDKKDGNTRYFENVVLETQHLPTDHPLFMYDAGEHTYNFPLLVSTMAFYDYELCDCVVNNCAAAELDCSFVRRKIDD